MKRLTTILALTLAFALPITLSTQAQAEPKPERHEHHPEIHKAIASLEAAKHYMEHADHDFHGHRKEALEATERAIHQLRLAIESDKR